MGAPDHAPAEAAGGNGTGTTPPPPLAWRDPGLWLVLGLTLVLCWPQLLHLDWMGDEGILLNAAWRMRQGQRLYVDLFEFLPPGGFLASAGWLAVFGPTFLSVRLLALAVYLGIAGLTYSTQVSLTAGGRASRLRAAGLTSVWVLCAAQSMGVGHHWLATLTSLLVGWALVPLARPDAGAGDRRRSGLACLVAGLGVGATGMITSHRGALIGLTALALLVVLRRSWRRALLLCGGAAAVIALCLIYLAAHGLLDDAFQSVIVFPARHYASIQAVPYGAQASSRNAPLVFIIPLAFVLGAVVALRDRRQVLGDRGLQASALLALCALLGSYPRPNVFHLQYTVPLALPLLAVAIERLAALVRPGLRLGVVATTGVLLVPALTAHLAFVGAVRGLPRTRLGSTEGVTLGAGTSPSELRPVLARLERLPPGEEVLFYPYAPLLPILTGHPQAAAHDLFTPGYTLPGQYRLTCESAVARARWTVIDSLWADPKFLQLVWPAIVDPQPPEKRAFEAALDRAYETVLATGRYRLLRRRDGARPGLCQPIAPRSELR